MTNPVVLNNSEHADLKVDTCPSAVYGDSANRTLAFLTEFADLHKHYPLLFHRDPESKVFHAHAILGFERDENLFLGEGEWLSDYIPAAIARGPFSIGAQEKTLDGEVRSDWVIMVDMDDPRVCDDGEPVFLQYGGDTAYLEEIKHILQIIHKGVVFDKAFYECLGSMDLIEPVSIEVNLSNIEKVNFRDYYTINKERLTTLKGAELEKLNQLGFLSLVFYALSSMSNFNALVQLKNNKQAMLK